jgi:hypothetical protein
MSGSRVLLRIVGILGVGLLSRPKPRSVQFSSVQLNVGEAEHLGAACLSPLLRLGGSGLLLAPLLFRRRGLPREEVADSNPDQR